MSRSGLWALACWLLVWLVGFTGHYSVVWRISFLQNNYKKEWTVQKRVLVARLGCILSLLRYAKEKEFSLLRTPKGNGQTHCGRLATAACFVGHSVFSVERQGDLSQQK